MPVFEVCFPLPLSIPCPACPQHFFLTNGPWRKHIRASHGAEASYKCVICSKTFPAINGASSHYVHCQRSSAAPTPTAPPGTSTSGHPSPSFACPDCNRPFGSKIGRSLHRKSAHPTSYNASLEPPVQHRFWSQEETAILANREALLSQSVRNVNQALSRLFPSRPLLAIKVKRRDRNYKSLVASLLPPSLPKSPSPALALTAPVGRPRKSGRRLMSTTMLSSSASSSSPSATPPCSPGRPTVRPTSAEYPPSVCPPRPNGRPASSPSVPASSTPQRVH